MPAFMPGLELSRRFYWEAVRPLLDEHFPGLPHAAALIGPGSEVLGLDGEISMDHDWYPRAQIFLREQDAGLEAGIAAALAEGLPHLFLGFPVDAEPYAPEPETRIITGGCAGPVRHGVAALTLRAFSQRWLSWEPAEAIEPADWLTFPSQILRSLTAGAVHHDGTGELTLFRRRLAWYPHDVWLYLLASGWQRIGQEEHLMPRAGHAGDELGSAVIGARLVRDAMSLCFLMERVYAPYPKWFGTAFGQLPCAADLGPMLWRAMQAPTWPAREAALVEAYEYLARRHNRLGITDPLEEKASGFYDRPFRVIHGERFAEAIRARIVDPAVQAIADSGLIGSVDQLSDSTDVRSHGRWRLRLKTLYAGECTDQAGRTGGPMDGQPEGRFEVVVEEGVPRGDLYELEQVTHYRVVDRASGHVVLSFEGRMEAALSRDTGQWEGSRISGVQSVTIAEDGRSVIVRYGDGREDVVSLGAG